MNMEFRRNRSKYNVVIVDDFYKSRPEIIDYQYVVQPLRIIAVFVYKNERDTKLKQDLPLNTMFTFLLID